MSMFSAGSGSRLVLASVVLLGLGACRTTPPVVDSVPPPPPVPESIPGGAREFKIVPQESLLQILVYRGGAMARLGHNHVIASHDLAGSVYVTEDLSQSRFDVEFPVGGLTIDEPAMRETAGPDFPAGVPQNARDGTRKNMLSDALLDGANFPSIRLRAREVVAVGETFEVDVEITLKDQVHHVRVPMQVELEEGVVTATGEFPLRQSQLGLEPFSAAMGALLVVDEMRVRFEVRAQE